MAIKRSISVKITKDGIELDMGGDGCDTTCLGESDKIYRALAEEGLRVTPVSRKVKPRKQNVVGRNNVRGGA